MKNKIIQGDCLEVLKTLEDESVDCVVTSPPYWALRDYGVAGQLGLEPTFQEYITKLCDIFDEVKRVLKKEGTCWVNMGDAFSGGVNNNDGKKVDGAKAIKAIKAINVPDKCLLQIPSRFAIEMTRRRGFIVKTEIDEAWLGGIIEGEGCITIAHHNGYYEPRVQIAMVNKGVLDRVQQITGVGIVSKQTERNNPKWRDSYIWKASGSTAAKICSDVFDYLVSKKEQARIIWRMVEMQKERERTGGDPYSKVGQKYSEKQITERQEWFEEIKRHNQGNGTPTKLKNPTKNEPWILRNTIIWHKPNCMPSSVKDRFTVDFEKVFFFVKSKKYWFETQYEELANPNRTNFQSGKRTNGINKDRNDNDMGERSKDFKFEKRNKRAVWTISTKPFKEAHFATYPEALIEPMIKAGCPENGIVLDPFFGAGTTGLVAKKQNKNYIGIELNTDYIKIAEARLQAVPNKLF